MSYVSMAGAAANYAAQLANGAMSFEDAKAASSADWEAGGCGAVLGCRFLFDLPYFCCDLLHCPR